MTKKAFAISAHPDDIEFMMAGTLLLLKKAGYEIHYMTVANGSLGSSVYSGMELPIVRGGEAKASAEIMGAIYHPPICADMEIFVNVETQSRMVPIIREVAPDIILTHGPYDYMEDHVNAGRLACTAAFARGMPNFRCTPVKVAENDVAIYHSLPLSLKDQLNKRIVPDFFVNVETEVETKKKALACHKSEGVAGPEPGLQLLHRRHGRPPREDRRTLRQVQVRRGVVPPQSLRFLRGGLRSAAPRPQGLRH